MKKKNLIVLLGMVLFCGFGFSQASKDVKVWVMPTEGKNLENAESRWLPDEVHKVLRANITNYSELTVAEENADVLAEIQDKSYNENISKDDRVRMGKQIGANYVIRSTITMAGSSYTLNIIFQDLEGGTHFAETNNHSKHTDGLYMNPGCAVNEATIELCKKLDDKGFGTQLSSYNERILRYGANDLSAEDEKKYLDDEVRRLNELIKNLDKEINSANLSAEIDAETKKIQLQLKKTQEEEKLKQAQQRQKRLAQEAANKAAELEDQKIRSEEQKKRITDTEKTLNKKIESLRNKKYDASSALAQIGVIEAKKKAILELREKRSAEEEKINTDCELEVENKRKEIMAAPLRETQKNSSGEMLPKVKTERERLAQEEENRIRIEHKNNLDAINKLSIEAENALMSQINEHNTDLQKLKKADNIVKRNVKLDVNRFLGEKEGWSAFVTFFSDGEFLYSEPIDISYKALTGKDPDVLSDEYADEVDLYNSLFSKGVNPVSVEITYYFIPAPDNKPSVYILHVDTIKLTHTENGKKIQDIKVNADISRQMTPIYDIRDEGIKRKIAQKQQTKLEQQEQERIKNEEKQEREKIKEEEKREREKLKEEEKQQKALERIEKLQSKNHITFISLGVNAPFNISYEPDTTLNDTSFPLGMSAHLVSSYMYISGKGNVNCDFIKYSEKTSAVIGGTVSLGITPVHNSYWFIGLYGTFGFEKIENYSYPSYGGSVNMLFNFSNRFGIFMNVDATHRGKATYEGDEEIAPYDPLFLNSWRICPSIGFSYTFMRG